MSYLNLLREGIEMTNRRFDKKKFACTYDYVRWVMTPLGWQPRPVEPPFHHDDCPQCGCDDGIWRSLFKNTVHKSGDDCDGCWQGYPTECVCGGMIHGHLEDENRGCIVLSHWCEDCDG